MKSKSGNFTHPVFATDPRKFRALATGSHQCPEEAEEQGEIRKEKVRMCPGNKVAMAPMSEGFAAGPKLAEAKRERAQGYDRHGNGYLSGGMNAEPPEEGY